MTGNAGAEVAIDQHDDNLDHGRQQGKGHNKAFGVGVFIAINTGRGSPQKEREKGTKENGLPADGAGDDAGEKKIKHKVYHRRSAFFKLSGVE